MADAKFVKSPGWDWTVTYIDEDDGREEMSIFGVLTVEEAIKEARYSLPSDYAIVGVSRDA